MSRAGGVVARGAGLGSGRPRRRAGLVALALALAGCGGGPQFDGRIYRSERLSFRIGPVPSGFRRVASDESLLAFRDDAAGATLAIDARCRLDGDDVPLSALVQHLFLQFTERRELARRTFSLDGREALEVELTASLDGVARHFVVTVLKKDECVYDFVLVEERAEGDAGQGEGYRALVSGFATLDGSSREPAP